MNNETFIACKDGGYKDFTGVIMWGDNEGIVENACFKLEEYPSSKIILFYSGVWLNGVWKEGVWKKGIWRDGIWEDGIWKNGLWEGGTWKNGIDSYSNFRLVSPNYWTK